MADLSYIKPAIIEILQAPDTDLEAVSAKKVRKALEQRYPELDIKAHKAEIDAIIVEAFNEVMPAPDDEETLDEKVPVASTSNGTSHPPPVKRKRSPSPDGVPASSPGLALSAAPKGRAKLEMTDEELARQLHNEMNARNSRSGRSRALPSSGKGGGSRSKKSSQYVDDSDDDDGIIDMDPSSKPTKKRVKKERDPNKPASQTGFNKPWGLSPELAAVVGADTMSRGQVIKQLWAYIKENQLQDPEKKKVIHCDEKLQAIMGVPTTDAFKMNKPLQKHFYPLD